MSAKPRSLSNDQLSRGSGDSEEADTCQTDHTSGIKSSDTLIFSESHSLRGEL